jgi:DNA-directed RNA polymerase specialized sigma24 family protein
VAEAAAALNIKPVAARVRLHRARRALRSTSSRSFQLVVDTEVVP